MNVGIVETSVKGHYVSVNALMKIYASDPANNVLVFTTKEISDLLIDLDGFPNITVVSRQDGQDPDEFIDSMAAYGLDRLHLNSFDFEAKSLFRLMGRKTYLTIHDVNNCFPRKTEFWISFLARKVISSLLAHNRFELIKGFFRNLSASISMVYWQYRCVKKIEVSQGSFVVLSNAVASHFKNLRPKVNVISIPFSIYEGARDMTVGNQKLRICIPGSISHIRRSYFDLFDIIEDDLDLFKDSMELDLLGFINVHENGYKIIKRAKELVRKGLTIHYYTEFIDAHRYDEALSKADILLGNLNVNIHKNSKYSTTKETGVTFCMIRAGKPGLLPVEYQVPDELESSSVFYKMKDELSEKLKRVISDPQYLSELKNKAGINARKFSPDEVYRRLNTVSG